MAATSFSGLIFPSSYSTRASSFSRLTVARLTPGSLSKTVVMLRGQ